MAKPTIKTNPFARTEPPEGAPEEEAQPERNRPMGVYLPRPDKARFMKIAKQEGIKPTTLLTYAVKYFMAAYESGQVQFQEETKRTPKMPGK